MAGPTIDRDLGLRRFIRELQIAKVTEVVIGVQQGDMNGEGKQIAQYAAYNEFGSGRTPERSFMRTAFDENLPALQRDMEKRYTEVVEGTKTVYQALGLVGLYHQEVIKQKINDNVPPPNSPVTIALKGSSRTLIDTSAMKNSIHYIIRAVT